MSTIDGDLITPGTLPANRLTAAAEILRSQMSQVSNAPRPITPYDWRIWDSGALLPTAAAADDLGIAAGVWGSDNVTIQAGDLASAGATTRYAATQLRLPDYYQDGETVTLRLRAGMKTTIADNSCTIDAEVYKVEDDAAAGADLCNTVAQNMNAIAETDLDFEIDPAGLVAGDVLDVRIAIACNDMSTVPAVIPVLYKATLLFDAQG